MKNFKSKKVTFYLKTDFMRTLMKIFCGVICVLFLSSCGNNDMIGKYKKQPLPSDFIFKIIEDKSNDSLEKNQLSVEINHKITVEQIATLADSLFSSKPKQRRFYIFYLLPESRGDVWATSHFDPEIKIEILGSTTQQDTTTAKIAEVVTGDVIGKWQEEKYTSSNYVIYKKNNQLFIKTIFKDGQVSDEELKETKEKSVTRYDYKNGGYNGEYFVLNKIGNLEFYNSENINFTTAVQKK
jgi:hypothetical protein